MLKPRKRFGQHFLKDQYIIDNIITAIDPTSEDHLVEIGPGQGALTFPLMALYPELTLTLIEIDRDLVQFLSAKIHKNIQIYQSDVLKFDFSQLKKTPIRIMGNLPYNISTPLLFHLLTYKNLIKDMHFMLQQEVVDRLSASPHTKAYGRLSIMIQYDFDVIPLFSVPPDAFSPPPKVNSAIVRLIPKMPVEKIKNKALFEQIVREAFQHRRKTLKNALKNHLTEENMIKYNIDPTLRPEALSVDDYVKLCNRMFETNKER
jgi:16S rRNA (adenine1518-N6/adenine1519-N6)-dimethyltransferase